MLAELAELHPCVRETFAEASEGAGVDLWALSQGGPEEMLNRTEYTQPALLAAGVAVWRAVAGSAAARMPALLAGHSLGEYTALVAAGALSLHDGAHLVRLRGQLMQDAAPAGTGAMAAVLGAEDALVAEVCAEASGERGRRAGQLQLAGTDRHRRPRRRGRSRARAAAERGVRKAVKLAVSVPSHTPLMREAANRLAEAMAAAPGTRRDCRSCRTSMPKCTKASQSIRDALVRQLYLPVRGPAACRRSPRAAPRASPNAARARC